MLIEDDDTVRSRFYSIEHSSSQENNGWCFLWVEGEDRRFFFVDQSNQLILSSPLDYESHKELLITIHARNAAGGEPLTQFALTSSSSLMVTSSNVRVIVENVNDEAPQFVESSRVIRVSEGLRGPFPVRSKKDEVMYSSISLF